MLSVPKRLRYFLQRDSEALGAVLHIFLRVTEARLGAVSFVQRFGSVLNAHVHFHCRAMDGVFALGEDGQVHFAQATALTSEDLAAVKQQVRARVLRWFARGRHSRLGRCAGHGRLAPQRGLLAGCRGQNRRL